MPLQDVKKQPFHTLLCCPLTMFSNKKTFSPGVHKKISLVFLYSFLLYLSSVFFPALHIFCFLSLSFVLFFLSCLRRTHFQAHSFGERNLKIILYRDVRFLNGSMDLSVFLNLMRLIVTHFCKVQQKYVY